MLEALPASFHQVTQQLWERLQLSSLPMREAIQPHWERFVQALQHAWLVSVQPRLEAVHPHWEKFLEAADHLWDRLSLSAAPFLQALEEKRIQLQPHVAWAQEEFFLQWGNFKDILREVSVTQAACGTAALVILVIVSRFILVRVRRARSSTKAHDLKEDPPRSPARPARSPVRPPRSPVRPRSPVIEAPPAFKGQQNMPLTEAAQILSDAGTIRRNRTSSPANIQKVQLSDEQHSSLLSWLNDSTHEELLSMEGCGPASAERILRFRKQQGKFFDVTDMEKTGISKPIAKRIVNNVCH